jgi:hypothetical protein
MNMDRQTEESYKKSVKIMGPTDEVRTREFQSMDANRSELVMYTETSRKAATRGTENIGG